jgi:hypothetical protein
MEEDPLDNQNISDIRTIAKAINANIQFRDNGTNKPNSIIFELPVYN